MAETARERRPRGRPRPQETVARDEAVVALLRGSDAPLTKAELARATGTSESVTYLALRRLQQAGRVRFVPPPRGTRRYTWAPVG